MKLRTIIVDDEPLAREGLAMLLADESDVQIIQQCANGNDAVQAIEQQQPDLVFLDIQMPRMNGFEVVKTIGYEQMPMVVFVTAFDEHAVEAFRIHALDYLLKPLRKSRLSDSLDRIREQFLQRSLRQSGEQLRQLLKVFNQSAEQASEDGPNLEKEAAERIVVKSHGHVYFLQATDILWIEASGDYVTIHTKQKPHLLRDTMRNMENRLCSQGFKRIHRSTIINLSHVSELHTNKNNDYNVVLNDGTVLNLGRSYKDSLYAALESGD